MLRRVKPGSGKGADVFRKPDEQRHQHETEKKRHRAIDFPDLEIDRGTAEHQRGCRKQQPAEIQTEMVDEEIGIDRDTERDETAARRMVRKTKIEQAPGAADVAADAGIHEAGKQRHAGNAKEIRLWIDPGATRGLEDL